MSGLPTFDPGNALTRWAWEPSPGYPLVVQGDGTTAGIWHDFGMSGEKLGLNRELVERTEITRAKAAAKQLPGKLMTGGELDRDTFNAESDWIWAALLFGGADSPVLLETGAYRHRFHGSASDVLFPKTIQLRIDRDDGLIQHQAEVRIGQLAFTMPTKGVIQMKPVLVVGNVDYWGDVIPTAGNTSTAKPQIRGLSDAAFLDEDVLIKVSATASGNVTIKTKRGTPTSYSGTQVIPKGVWTWLLDQSGSPIGPRSRQVQVFLPLTGTYVVDDEWTFQAKADQWTPTPPLNVPANEIAGSVEADGVEIEVDSATITITNPAEAKYGYGGELPKRTRVRGERKVTAALAREYQQANFKRQLELLGSFFFRANIRSGIQVGTTGLYDYGLEIVMAGTTLSGKGASVESKTKMDEPVQIQGYLPTGDGTFPDDVYFDVINSIPDLLAA